VKQKYVIMTDYGYVEGCKILFQTDDWDQAVSEWLKAMRNGDSEIFVRPQLSITQLSKAEGG
jgi:hypothetical protein